MKSNWLSSLPALKDWIFQPTPKSGLSKTTISPTHADASMRILNRLFPSTLGSPEFCNDGDRAHLRYKTAQFTLLIYDPAVLRGMVLDRSPLPLVDGFINGQIEVIGDLFEAYKLKYFIEAEVLKFTFSEGLRMMWEARRLPAQPARIGYLAEAHGPSDKRGNWFSRQAARFMHQHSKESDSEAISFHYDVSNEFYQLWLDQQMVYSCAYFETAEDTLEQAQCNKLDYVCRKLRLAPGERFLDVGCGWGAMVCWAAEHYGVTAHGITISQQQFDYASARIKELGLEDRVTVEIRDYRDLAGESVYDKISSIGMFEHVGLAQLEVYNATIRRVLKPGGLFLNHGITHDVEGWKEDVNTRFINRYIFPDGELDRVSNIQRGMEHAGFTIHDVEALQSHYALTLRHWLKRLEARKEEALKFVPEVNYRTWRFYLVSCALVFEDEGTGIYQILASRPGGAKKNVPLTRRDLYAKPADIFATSGLEAASVIEAASAIEAASVIAAA